MGTVTIWIGLGITSVSPKEVSIDLETTFRAGEENGIGLIEVWGVAVEVWGVAVEVSDGVISV